MIFEAVSRSSGASFFAIRGAWACPQDLAHDKDFLLRFEPLGHLMEAIKFFCRLAQSRAAHL